MNRSKPHYTEHLLIVNFDVMKHILQAREEFRIIKHRKQVEWAAKIIQRHYIQWKVFKTITFKQFFYLVSFQRRQFLINLCATLPEDADSPISREWPQVPNSLAECNNVLRKIHHRWRCRKFRMKFDQTARNRMREKVTASFIFKDRKCSYPRRYIFTWSFNIKARPKKIVTLRSW